MNTADLQLALEGALGAPLDEFQIIEGYPAWTIRLRPSGSVTTINFCPVGYATPSDFFGSAPALAEFVSTIRLALRRQTEGV